MHSAILYQLLVLIGQTYRLIYEREIWEKVEGCGGGIFLRHFLIIWLEGLRRNYIQNYNWFPCRVSNLAPSKYEVTIPRL
jgi:hypothetical protein